MAFDISHITGNPIILLSGVFALIGWFITFIASCIYQSLYGAWWIVIYELLLLGGIFFVLATDSLPEYRLVILTFLAVSISLLTSFIGTFVNSSASSAQAIAAGAIFMIIVQFLWVLIFGSDESSAVNRSMHGLQMPSRPTANHDFKNGSIPLGSSVGFAGSHHQGSFVSPLDYQQPTAQPMMMQTTTPMINSPQVPHMTTPPMQQSPSSPVQNTATDVIESVTALHAYQANPEDATELSFSKGEVLDVLDKKGNWWQARKKDGTVGIIPSNYFSV